MRRILFANEQPISPFIKPNSTLVLSAAITHAHESEVHEKIGALIHHIQ